MNGRWQLVAQGPVAGAAECYCRFRASAGFEDGRSAITDYRAVVTDQLHTLARYPGHRNALRDENCAYYLTSSPVREADCAAVSGYRVQGEADGWRIVGYAVAHGAELTDEDLVPHVVLDALRDCT
ncbi:hypothetical protein D3C85_1207800 [compost metagenome]